MTDKTNPETGPEPEANNGDMGSGIRGRSMPETAKRIRERLTAMFQSATGAGMNASDTSDSFPTGKAEAATPRCPSCNDTGYLQVVGRGVMRCQCLRERFIAAKLAEIPKRFQDCSFANYIPCDGAQQRAVDLIAAEWTGSYLLIGDYGRGKTHLAIAQYRHLTQMEQSCLFFSMPELLNELRKAELDDEYFCEVRYAVRYRTRFHLFIDDIDKFKVTDFKFEVLFDLLDTLYRRNLGLTVTTNLAIRELRRNQTLDGAILRRIEDICKAVTL
jgi:DNA replication protein DnaC